MRTVFFVALIAALASGLVPAQPANGQSTGSPAARPARHTARPAGTPLDKGPFTPEANRAFQGGGMILQGEPGAPPPRPEPTPPGQTPRNMVPP
jgi:hypothetical protein